MTQKDCELEFKEPLASIRPLDAIDEEPIEWFWENRIPYGKLTLLDGDPGIGKSVFMCHLASLASLGKPLPGENPAIEKPHCRTLILSEDNPSTSIKPRIKLAGGDLSEIYIQQGIIGKNTAELEPFTLDQIAQFSQTLRHYKPNLVIIDPIINFVDEQKTKNTNGDLAIRRLLKPLDDLAREHGCSIIGLRHLNKDNFKTAIQRGSGSMQYAGTARSVYMVVQHPRDKNLKLFCQVKINDGPPMKKSIIYSIQAEGNIPFVKIEGEEEISADDVLLLGTAKPDEKEPSKQETARRLLRLVLRNGPVPEREAMVLVKEWKISERTINEAKKGLVNSRKKGDEWFWRLADDLQGDDSRDA